MTVRSVSAIMFVGVASCIEPDWRDSPEAGVVTNIDVTAALPMVVGENRALPVAWNVNARGDILTTDGMGIVVQWTSRDSSVAKLDGSGRVTAGVTPASTYLVARNGEFADSTLVTVDGKYRSWPDAMRLIPGGSRKLVVRAGAEVPGTRDIIQAEWESSDPSIATVGSDGVVMAKSAGDVSIIARRGAFTATTHLVITSYPRELSFVDFGVGPRGVCAMDATDTTWCWGDHRPIDGVQTDRCVDGGYGFAYDCSASPLRMSAIPFAKIVSAKVDAWFSQEPVGPYGLAKDGGFYRLEESGPVRLAGGMQFKAVWGGRPLCGATITDGLGFCWGLNWQGFMGIGHAQEMGPWPQTPTQMSSGVKWTQFARGDAMCGLAETGVVYCWGRNTQFGAGIGKDSTPRPGCGTSCVVVPTAVETDARFTQLAGGNYEVCALATIGETYCWGWGATDNGAPYRVVIAPAFVSLFGNATVCGVDAAGTAYCLPRSRNPIPVPFPFAKVNLPFPVTKIVMGEKLGCALSAANGRLYCWGTGALGGGESVATATENNPVEVWGQRLPTQDFRIVTSKSMLHIGACLPAPPRAAASAGPRRCPM